MFTRNENLEVVFGEVKVVEVAVKGKLPFLLFTQTEEILLIELNSNWMFWKTKVDKMQTYSDSF